MKAARLAADMSMNQLGKLARTTHHHIRLLEKGGIASPGIELLGNIASALGLAVSEITGEEVQESSEDPGLSELQMNALAIRKLDPEEYEMVVRQLAERRAFVEKRAEEEKERRRRAKRDRPATDKQPQSDNS